MDLCPNETAGAVLHRRRSNADSPAESGHTPPTSSPIPLPDRKRQCYLERRLAGPNRANLMYELGYWAEAVSLAPGEQAEGVRAIESDLLPPLERAEHHNPTMTAFFRQFPRVLVIDTLQHPIFSRERLSSMLELSREQSLDHLVLRTYRPK